MTGLITVPKKVVVKAVSAEGITELNAFDNCLIQAGLGNISLVKITSLLPSDIEILDEAPQLPNGANVPAIYAYKISSLNGQKIAAALALGWTNGGPTLVAEYADEEIDSEYAEKEVLRMLRKMAEARNLELTRYEVVSVDHVVKSTGCVLVIAAEVE
ncbi:MAG: pyruvoyl-dependent arginine decarboxylase [Candidatus Njordarchaeia archaeon]|nr:pyruvoyl-dependent arginine decarboxylase [Candidatus Korarchaeota archaeon]